MWLLLPFRLTAPARWQDKAASIQAAAPLAIQHPKIGAKELFGRKIRRPRCRRASSLLCQGCIAAPKPAETANLAGDAVAQRTAHPEWSPLERLSAKVHQADGGYWSDHRVVRGRSGSRPAQISRLDADMWRRPEYGRARLRTCRRMPGHPRSCVPWRQALEQVTISDAPVAVARRRITCSVAVIGRLRRRHEPWHRSDDARRHLAGRSCARTILAAIGSLGLAAAAAAWIDAALVRQRAGL